MAVLGSLIGTAAFFDVMQRGGPKNCWRAAHHRSESANFEPGFKSTDW